MEASVYGDGGRGDIKNPSSESREQRKGGKNVEVIVIENQN